MTEGLNAVTIEHEHRGSTAAVKVIEGDRIGVISIVISPLETALAGVWGGRVKLTPAIIAANMVLSEDITYITLGAFQRTITVKIQDLIGNFFEGHVSSVYGVWPPLFHVVSVDIHKFAVEKLLWEEKTPVEERVKILTETVSRVVDEAFRRLNGA